MSRVLDRMLAVRLLILIVMSLPAHVLADDRLPDIRPGIAMKAIATFRADPASPDAVGLLSVVANFARRSDEVFVIIDRDHLPDDFTTVTGEPLKILLGAFVAGNVEAQLSSGVRGDRPAAGVRLMLHAYRALREEDRLPVLPSFESWPIRQEQGEPGARVR